MWPFLIPILFVLTIAALVIWQIRLFFRREAFIRTFVLPKGLYDNLRAKHPALSLKECQLVARGLRQFFLTHLKSGRKHVAMPSQVVDDLWHEFILYTRNYQQFCDKAFERFFHHTPAAVMGAPAGRTMLASGAAGGMPAVKRTSMRAAPPACRSCLPWIPSSTFPTAIAMHRIAQRSASKPPPLA